MKLLMLLLTSSVEIPPSLTDYLQIFMKRITIKDHPPYSEATNATADATVDTVSRDTAILKKFPTKTGKGLQLKNIPLSGISDPLPISYKTRIKLINKDYPTFRDQ